MYPALSWLQFWEHQIRWARTVRLVRPGSFFGLVVTHGLPWVVVAALLAPSWGTAAAYLAGYSVLRLTLAWVAGVWGVGDNVLRRKLWLVPLRDAIHFFVWFAGFTSNRVNWGGTEYEVRNGKMSPVASASLD